MTAMRLIPIVLVAALPTLAMAQVPPIQSPPGMTPDASNAVLPNALSNLGALPHVATNAALSAKSNASAPQGVYRDHYYTGGVTDGPLLFQPQTGTCAANSWVNDGGNCVDSTSGDGNSWKALHRNNTLNVREFGAKGDNSTDDSAAIQAMAAAAGSATPGYYQAYQIFPSGNYCVTAGTTISAPAQTLVGYGNAVIKMCGAHDVTPITLNGTKDAIRDLSIQGYNSPTATTPALVLGSGCVECFVGERVLAQYGSHAISSAAPDAKIWAKAVQAYGSSLALGTAGGFWLRNKFDQPYPTGTPPAGNPTLSAWASGHVYAANDLYTIAAGAWVLQITTGCTSSGSAPSVAAYATDITNGSDSCHSQLAGPNPYYALELQTGATPTFVDKLDATGSFADSVALGTDAGAGPQQVTLRDINAGTPMLNGVLAIKGQGLFIVGGSATNCVLAGCIGVHAKSTWGQNLHIGGGFLAYANPVDVWIEGGIGTVISGASLHGSSSQCIDIAAGVNDFTIVGNDLTTGSIWGSCAASVKVETGSSDRYNIIGNLVSGTAPVDNGSGANKTIFGNH